MYKTVTQSNDGATLNIKESTYLKDPAKYDAKAKDQPVVIHRADGSSMLWNEYRLLPLCVKERYYINDPQKYDDITQRKVIIVCKGGLQYELSQYKVYKQAFNEYIVLPDSGFAHAQVDNKKLQEYTVTDEDQCNCNHANALHLLVWWNHSLLERQGNYVVLKSHPQCYVTPFGIWDSQTLLLSPIYIALQKYLHFTMLEAYYICTTFLQQANKKNLRAIIHYTAINYGFGELPTVEATALNYILEEDILGVDPAGYATLFGLLKDRFYISKEVIWEMINRKLIIVDSNYNICFLSYDRDGNITSIYKMSRYYHNDEKLCYNHYVTKLDVAFGYCSEEAERNDLFDFVTVFDHPLELLSYLTLERKSTHLVPSFHDQGGYYMAMYYSNTFAVKEWLRKHDEVAVMSVATCFMKVNSYVNKLLIDIGTKAKVCRTQELNQLIVAYREKTMEAVCGGSFRLAGWNSLLKLYLNKKGLKFKPIMEYVINAYAKTPQPQAK